ncbi:hypothetical protein, partial [Pseudoduganella sp. RAF53_2]
MKRFISILFLVAAPAFAKSPVSFDFNGVPVSTFAQATFRTLLHRDYVMAPELVGAEKRITVNVGALDEAEVPAFVEGVLAQQGIAVSEKKGIYYLSAAKTELRTGDESTPQEVVKPDVDRVERPPLVEAAPDAKSVVYNPQNRSSDFLVTVLTSAFGTRSAHAAGAAVLLVGSEKDLGKMVELVTALDSMPKRVDVSASWVEVTDSGSSGRGISVLASVLGAKFGAQLGPVSSPSAITLKNANFQLVLDVLNTD